ncbi:MAG: FAD-dependent oxidoreductase [Planctomycetota bacterium]|nr:MAG: FAD-dependent oxidoreductase [Planctomycetota bacterium]GDY07138.1 phytoene dehydrogenase [Planctomycetia bacterium]
MSDVIVIGGGLAGLASSVALAQAGVTVTLLESRPRLGGRASSFEDAATGELIDNCQHVAMGCCTNFRHFCRATGIEASFRSERELFFVAPPTLELSVRPRICRFSAMPLPAPLHLAAAFLRLSYLSWQEKLALARGLKALARERSDATRGKNFADWLAEQRQPTNVIERFWWVVLVSALSESLDRVSVAAAQKVFVDGFLANRHGWEVWLPTVPLDELYSGQLTQWLTSHGVEVRLKSGVERLVLENDRVTAVELRNGERLSAQQFVLAVPQHRVRSFLPDEWHNKPPFDRLDQLETAPIASVHLWFDRPITQLPHAVLVGRLSQWMFNRSKVPSETDLTQSSEPGTRNYFQIIISNAREVAKRPQAEVIAEVVAELKAIWPEAALAELRHSRMIVEHTAVFSPLPGSEDLRPAQQSPIANLQLAGDWTQTGWPATMEGAVRSGFLAAENVARSFGRETRMLQPDLPVSWLNRWWMGRVRLSATAGE